MDASLTHGIENGVARWPDEMPQLERIGRENFAAIREAIGRHGIDARLRGDRRAGLRRRAVPGRVHRRGGRDRPRLRLAGRGAQRRAGPGRGPLADLPRRGLRARRPRRWSTRRGWPGASPPRRAPAGVQGVRALAGGAARARRRGRARDDGRPAWRCAPAAPCWPPARSRRWCARSGATSCRSTTTCSSREPLGREQRESLGWARRQGLTDMGNQFHYYRLTADDRILFGGYDAIYNFRNGMGPHLDERPASFELLATPLLRDLPPARGAALHPPLGWRDRHLLALLGDVRQGARRPRRVRGRLHRPRRRPRAASAPRWRSTSSTAATPSAPGSSMVRSKPIPFPPEPLRWAGITLTRRALARADRRGAGAVPGCACWTGWGWGSTASLTPARSSSREQIHQQPVLATRRRRSRMLAAHHPHRLEADLAEARRSPPRSRPRGRSPSGGSRARRSGARTARACVSVPSPRPMHARGRGTGRRPRGGRAVGPSSHHCT